MAGLRALSLGPRDVPAVIDECAVLGIRNVIVISAGFKERGEAGAELEMVERGNHWTSKQSE